MSYTEIFNQALPYYLAIGMPYELYWHGDPYLVKAYIEAHELALEKRNQEMWIQGLYNYQAFKTVIEAFSYGLNGGKGNKPGQYPSTPIPFTAREKKAESERKARRMKEVFEEHK